MKQFIVVGLLAAATTVTGQVGPQNKFHPFTATVVETLYGPQGSSAWNREYTYGVREDGSSVQLVRWTGPDNLPSGTRIIVDFSARKRVTVDESTESLTTYGLSGQAIEMMWNKMTDCQAAVDSREAVLGYAVVQWRRLLRAPPGQRLVLEQWLAPALNCYPLREVLTMTTADGRARTMKEVTAVRNGAPADSLFFVPQEYTERSPSEVFAERARRYPGSPPIPDNTSEILDRAYGQGARLKSLLPP